MLENAELVLVGANDVPWSSWDRSDWYWTMGAHGLLWLTAIALISLAVVIAIRSSRSDLAGAGNSARSALITRYARGEIERGEYRERKRDLA